MNYPDILGLVPDPVRTRYRDKDAILYALGIGMGLDPADPAELRYVYEKDLRVVPTMAVIVGGGAGAILTGGGIDLTLLVHGEQRLRVHNVLPPAASVISHSRCLGVVDKGVRHGALLHVESTIADAQTGLLFATAISTLFCRGDGGFGGPSETMFVPHDVPDCAPDREVVIATRPGQALLYRLNGDRNPLHCDAEFAAKAGFDRPILHGLCSYGIACRAILQAYCDHDPAMIRAFDVRFSSPVYPGETIVTRMWRDGHIVSFECHVAERGVTVIRNGRCELAA